MECLHLKFKHSGNVPPLIPLQSIDTFGTVISLMGAQQLECKVKKYETFFCPGG